MIQLAADLASRRLLQQLSDPEMDRRLTALASTGPVAAYAGFDPTADSLHVGHFMGILGLIYAQRNGIRPIAVVGGATGLIGDPGGKTTERPLLTRETVAANVEGLRNVLSRFLDFDHKTAPAQIVNNLDWFGSMTAVDFLRDVGRHFRLGAMLSKESVKLRMEQSVDGMSYTEFSYQLLQGYDFYRLYRDHRCVLQMGGSDQWGNIIAGVDLIRRMEGESGHAFGLTWPLMTTSSGQKFGKSEGNAVWLSAEKTTPFDFYQFWLRVEDADAGRYLRYVTFLNEAEIADLMKEQESAPEKRFAQKRLAEEITRLVHGDEPTRQAVSASEAMYGAGPRTLDAAAIEALRTQGVASVSIERAKLAKGWSAIDAAVESSLAKSKGEARRLIQQGGLYVNDLAVTDIEHRLTTADLVEDKAIVLRAGKKHLRLVYVQ